MALYRADALVLRRFKLGEADLIVSFLTRERGKMRAVARSSRRPKSKFAGALEPLSRVHLEYYGRENADLFRVNSADVLRSFDKLRRDYEKVKSALVLAELLDRLLEDGEAQPAIFDLSLGVLDWMEGKDSAEDPLIFFEVRFLRELGYAPNLDRCARCEADLAGKGAVFRAGAGELLCPGCAAGGLRLSPGAVRHLSAVGSLPLERAFQAAAAGAVRAEVRRFLQAYLTGLSGARLKSLRFLES
ncbi:MAG: DNA repair protein RecO [Candidatus Tectomicrobia bacterium]|nr:DNA repair protein RecO [Candidatus Tectomicrobia bacterium]